MAPPDRNSNLIKRMFDFGGAPLLMVGVGVLFYLESRHVLRERREAKARRLKTNVAVAATAALGLRLVLIPALVALARQAEKRKFGLVRWLGLPTPLAHLLSFLLLDYGNYRWHRLNHSAPFLWRFHQVHHADLDLDVSTAFRFHVGEVLASVAYRGLWVLGMGAGPRLVLVYELLFEGATNFHHSNLRLPAATDRLLARFLVTPRMHGIHHSIVRQETDSNFSVILTVWDRLHRTLLLNIPQEEITIGVPYVREHLGAGSLLRMPFSHPSRAWALPDGTEPRREPADQPA